METKGFNESGISERNKEIKHFTETPDIQHFATVKISENDNVYGVVKYSQ